MAAGTSTSVPLYQVVERAREVVGAAQEAADRLPTASADRDVVFAHALRDLAELLATPTKPIGGAW